MQGPGAGGIGGGGGVGVLFLHRRVIDTNYTTYGMYVTHSDKTDFSICKLGRIWNANCTFALYSTAFKHYRTMHVCYVQL